MIAHSLDAMAAAYAVQKGLSPKRTVLVAPHLEVQKMFETFRDLLNMRPALAQRLHDKIGARMKTLMNDNDPWKLLSPEQLLDHAALRGMLVYDHEDPEVSEAQFLDMIDHWPGCEVRSTRGLGHNRILKDESVIEKIVDYLKS